MTTQYISSFKYAACAALFASIASGCATVQDSGPSVQEVMRSSFTANGIAGLDRLDQNPTQQACTRYATAPDLPKDVRESLEKQALASVKPPADGKWMGDWKEGERIAQSGRGMQFTDTAQTVAGGNCYACHQISPAELSYGNLGPSLLGYGKLRGTSEAILQYTWGKIYNPNAYNACSQMPRFGHAAILTEQQIKHVMALLLDPESPVNK